MEIRGKVLICDDDPLLCELIATKLRRLGWLPTSVGNLGSAMVEMNKGPWDVMLLDLKLPDSSSIERTLAMVPMFKHRGVKKVAVMTGAYQTEEVARFARDYDVDAFFSKDASEFVDAFKALFEA